MQLAASLILVGQNVPDCHAHLPQLLKCVSDGGRRVDEEEVGIILTFFQELAQKYSGFEYVRKLECIITHLLVCVSTCIYTVAVYGAPLLMV